MAGQQRVYLDYNASAPLRPEAAEAFLRVLQLPGNASSVHQEGRAARAEMETARDAVAALAGVAPKAVVFTSGGTEANNLALSPDARPQGTWGDVAAARGRDRTPQRPRGASLSAACRRANSRRSRWSGGP